MMGFGYLGNGGSSSSSSNLSPLAAPFTVDRSNPTPYSNPLVPYDVPFHAPVHNWQYAHSANDYGYLGSQSLSSATTHMPPLNPSVSDATNAFTFLQYSNDRPSECVEAKPFYPLSVSSMADDAIPLVALNESSYDSLSTSRVAPFSGTSRVDYTSPLWGSFWNRLADEEQDKQKELDGSFCLEETNGAGSFVCKEYLKQGACTADSSSTRNKASAVSSKNCIDVFGRRSQFGFPTTENLNDKSSSLQDPMFTFRASPRPAISLTSSTHQESHVHVPSLQSATNFWNNGNPYSVSYDKWFQPLDSCMNDSLSVKNPSPAIVIRPPSTGTSSAKPKKVASEDVAVNSKDFGCHYSSNQKEPLLPLIDSKAGSLDTSQKGNNDDLNALSSNRKEQQSNTKGGLDHMPKAGKEYQLPDINIPYGFASVEYSSESLDPYDPVVDSPCWKGAPASHFSPSEASEVVTPETQISPPCAEDNVKVSCQNPCENSVYHVNAYVELGSLLCPEKVPNANCPSRENSASDALKAGFNCPNPSSSNEFLFSNDMNNSRKECDVPKEPKGDSDLKPSHAKQLGLDKGDFISGREFKLHADNSNEISEDGTVSFHGMKSTSCSHCSSENVNKLVKMHATESMPKMNVQMLVDTIHSLSELLLFQCSNDASAVSAPDPKAVQHIINNLGACVLKKITSSPESVSSQQCTYHEFRNLPDHNMGVSAGRPPVATEADTSSQFQFNHDSIHEGKRFSNMSGKEVQKFPDFVSLRGNADIVKDDNMVEAIKDALKMDFNGEEEMQPETLLYKNLWLEAEAALCSFSYRARFNRIKIEMEKCKSRKAKAKSTMAVAKLLHDSKVSTDPNISQKVTPEAKDIPLSDNKFQDSPISCSTKVVDDVEASALARFYILTSRHQNSNSVSKEGRQLSEEDDSLDVTVRPYSQYCSDTSKVDKFGSHVGQFDRETMKELGVCARDDQAIQSCGNDRLRSQLPSGWCDGSSPDWEHVLKDEFASQK